MIFTAIFLCVKAFQLFASWDPNRMAHHSGSKGKAWTVSIPYLKGSSDLFGLALISPRQSFLSIYHKLRMKC